MTEIKTRPNDQCVEAFWARIEDETWRRDALRVDQIMSEVTGEPATIWGESIVGYESSHYRYATGREGDWFLVGFSPRIHNVTLYLVDGFDAYASMLARLGKHKIGKSCLYLKQLRDIDPVVLRELIRQSVAHVRATNTP